MLKELGLSRTEIRCYARLIEEGPDTARKLAEHLKISPSNIYGALDNLVEEGYIEKFKLPMQSAWFMARLPNLALAENYIHRRGQVLSLCRELLIGDPPMLYITPMQKQAGRKGKGKP